MIYILVSAVAALTVFMLVFGRRGINGIRKLRKPPRFLLWKVIYTDMYVREKKDGITYGKILYSEKYELQGKPDIIYRHRITGEILPVEIKSGQTDCPHNGDLLQVGAYMLIIEDIYNRTPKKTIILYKNNSFVVKNTHFMRNWVLETANKMRTMLETGEEEAKPSFANCRNCVCDQTVCEYSYNNED